MMGRDPEEPRPIIYLADIVIHCSDHPLVIRKQPSRERIVRDCTTLAMPHLAVPRTTGDYKAGAPKAPGPPGV
jgi:hypothetical protein